MGTQKKSGFSWEKGKTIWGRGDIWDWAFPEAGFHQVKTEGKEYSRLREHTHTSEGVKHSSSGDGHMAPCSRGTALTEERNEAKKITQKKMKNYY